MTNLDKKAIELNGHKQQLLERITDVQKIACLNLPCSELSIRELNAIGLE
jgi:hypothetical protein